MRGSQIPHTEISLAQLQLLNETILVLDKTMEGSDLIFLIKMIYNNYIGTFCTYPLSDYRGGTQTGSLDRSNEPVYVPPLIREEIQ